MSPTLTRRALIAGAGTTVASAALAIPYVSAVSSTPADTLTAEQRRDFHLAEYKRACEEVDPFIRSWTDMNHTDACGGGTISFRISGQYEGDGVYETGRDNVLGKRSKYQVALRPGLLIDGERTFDVSCPGDRMMLIESRLETFVGRRLA